MGIDCVGLGAGVDIDPGRTAGIIFVTITLDGVGEGCLY
jgi:hypothetical protein